MVPLCITKVIDGTSREFLEPSPNFDRAKLKLYFLLFGTKLGLIPNNEFVLFRALQFCDRVEH